MKTARTCNHIKYIINGKWSQVTDRFNDWFHFDLFFLQNISDFFIQLNYFKMNLRKRSNHNLKSLPLPLHLLQISSQSFFFSSFLFLWILRDILFYRNVNVSDIKFITFCRLISAPFRKRISIHSRCPFHAAKCKGIFGDRMIKKTERLREREK